MSELLALHAPGSSSAYLMPSTAAMHAKLVKADFHGAIITGVRSCFFFLEFHGLTVLAVRQSKNPCLVGLSGIIVYESENAFRVITKEDKLKRTVSILYLSSL